MTLLSQVEPIHGSDGSLKAMYYEGFDNGLLSEEAKKLEVWTAIVGWTLGDGRVIDEEVDVLAASQQFASLMVKKVLERDYTPGGVILELIQQSHCSFYF